jgi:glycosyltransferase involved in cell wall biosynthesis
MRILHVIGSVAPRLGGPSRVVLQMSAALAALGHEVEVVTTGLTDRGTWLPFTSSARKDKAAASDRVAQDGYSITYCRPTWPTRWATSLELVSVLRAHMPETDVVHIHSLYLFPTLVASRLARVSGVPYVVRPHGTLDPFIRRRHRIQKRLYHRLVEDSTLRHSAAVHFTTVEERDLALPILPPDVHTSVIPLGVDLEEFDNLPDRQVARAVMGLRPEQFVWLFLGRLNHKKGLDILASAFAQFSKVVPGARLIVAGPDDDGLGRRLLEDCAVAGVAEAVQLPGFLNRAEMRQVLAAADSWILPSYSENFGVAVAEAMAARLPVLITDKVNIWPAVEESRTGVVTQANSGSVLAGMLRLAGLPTDERAAMGERGRDLCRTSFSWRNAALELSALYAKVFTGTRSRGLRSA